MDNKKMGRLFGEVARLHFHKVRSALADFGLGRGQPPVLDMLAETDAMTQVDIAKNIGITPATATVMLQGMEKSGLITRRIDENDQRCVLVFITPKGRRINLETSAVLADLEERVFSCLDGGEKEDLRRALLKLKDCLKEMA